MTKKKTFFLFIYNTNLLLRKAGKTATQNSIFLPQQGNMPFAWLFTSN